MKYWHCFWHLHPSVIFHTLGLLINCVIYVVVYFNLRWLDNDINELWLYATVSASVILVLAGLIETYSHSFNSAKIPLDMLVVDTVILIPFIISGGIAIFGSLVLRAMESYGTSTNPHSEQDGYFLIIIAAVLVVLAAISTQVIHWSVRRSAINGLHQDDEFSSVEALRDDVLENGKKITRDK